MNCTLIIGITAIACSLAEQIENDEELALLASALTQLADTLNTFVAQRELSENTSESSETPPVF